MALDDYAAEGEPGEGDIALVEVEARRQTISREEREDMDDKERLLLLRRWSDPLNLPNIAEFLPDDELGRIGMKVVDETQIDDQSRSDWKDKSKDALEMAMQIAKSRTGPWPGSSNVVYPLILQAAAQFAARSYPAVVADRNVVKGTVYGEDKGTPAIDPQTGQPVMDPQTGEPVWAEAPGAKRERADRIGAHMSWQKTQEDPNWEPDTDKLLHVLPIMGACFRKTWFDTAEGRKASSLIFPDKLIINYWAKSIYTAPRLTEELEFYPHEVEQHRRSGFFLDQEYGPSRDMQDPDAPIDFYEQHRRLDLDEDGYSEPYIVTVDKLTHKVARIVARFDPDGIMVAQDGRIALIQPDHYYTSYELFPNFEGGIYGLGFGQLLIMLNQQINTTLNQLFDAGTLAISGGGFLGKGLSMHSGAVKFRPGEYKLVNALGGTVRENVVQLTFPGPSEQMFKLLGLLVEAGRDIAAIKDILTGDRVAANTPATTIMALIEQGLKVYTAMFKRVHRSLAEEFDKDFKINKLYLNSVQEFSVGNQPRIVYQDDYIKGAGIEPVSDPKNVSDMQRLGRAEFLRQFIDDPNVDGKEIRRRIFEAAGIERINEVIPTEQPPNPQLIIETARLEIEMIEARAKVVNQLSQAFKYLAEGDAKMEDQGRAWVEQELNALTTRMEMLSKDTSNGGAGAEPGTGGAGNGTAAGVAGNPREPVSGVATAPVQ